MPVDNNEKIIIDSILDLCTGASTTISRIYDAAKKRKEAKQDVTEREFVWDDDLVMGFYKELCAIPSGLMTMNTPYQKMAEFKKSKSSLTENKDLKSKEYKL